MKVNILQADLATDFLQRNLLAFCLGVDLWPGIDEFEGIETSALRR
jgi:hypothetical protein